MPSDSIPLVRQIAQGDRDWVAETLVLEWTSTSVARLGELVEAAGLPGYLATLGGRRVGLVLVDVRDRVRGRRHRHHGAAAGHRAGADGALCR
ncbi:MAG: hypothetical protein L0H96_09705 [Humibacillus sp.]|nr:hypothetical protein [Humibacillus sp.]MDN5777174.1 hypothetical protein [Humibacillus sp.]